MTQKADSFIGRVRSFFWPIYPHERRKLLPMLVMLFLICFCYSLLRNMKDALVVTAESSGAEVIPFIKVWVMLPMAVVLTFIFTKLSNRFSQERVFYLMTSAFLLFYALFAFVLYPARDFLHPHHLANIWESSLPAGFKGIVAMCRNWTFTAFYVMSELWGSIVLTVLFWGFANEVTKIGEARRFYSVFGVGANLAAIAAGQVGNCFSQNVYNPKLPFGHDVWGQTLIELVLVIIACGAVTMGIFYWMNKRVLNDPSFESLHAVRREQKANKKLSVRESFSYLSNSKYLICVAALVLCYNLSINLVEVVWKDQLKSLYPSPNEYNTYMNNLTTMIGIVSTLTALFMAKIIKRFGWTFTALATPLVVFMTSAGFFSFLFFGDSFGGAFMAVTGMTPFAIAVFFGGAQNCFSKAAKYSVFDTTKEMAFIPLSHECKLKGKAAIDGIGSRLGKSGGSLIHQGLLMVFSTLSASAPYVAAVLTGVISIWILAIRSLGKQFYALVLKQETSSLAELSGEDSSGRLQIAD